MGLFKPTIIAGLDIGQETTKLVITDLRGKQPAVRKTAVLSNRDEGIMDIRELQDHIGEWCRENGVLKQEVVLGVPQYLAIVQLSDFPPAKPQQLAGLVAMETQQLAGLSDEAFQSDYRRLKPVDGLQNPVLIGVCREQMTWQRIDLLEDSGVRIHDLFMDGDALAAVYNVAIPPADQKSALDLLIDIGHEGATMVIMQDGQPVHIGNIGVGGMHFTSALCRGMGLSEPEAERLKRESRINSSDFSSPLTTAARHFGNELQNAIEQWHHQQQNEDLPGNEVPRFKHVFLSGGGAKLKGLDEFLRLLLDTDVKMLPVPGLDADKQAGFAVAYGLGLLARRSKEERLSLAPRSLMATVQRSRRLPFLWAAVVSLALGLTAWLLLSWFSLQAQAQDLVRKDAHLRNAKTLINNVKETRAEIETMELMLLPFVSRGNRNQTMVQAIQALGEHGQDGDWYVLLADGESYISGLEADPEGSIGTTSSKEVFGMPLSKPGADSSTKVLPATSCKPWTYLVASGFTPERTQNSLANVRKTVELLNKNEDTIFKSVDVYLDPQRSRMDVSMTPVWRRVYRMKPFALHLPLKQLEFDAEVQP